ncbi:MAG: ferritin-like domain-containing protein [Longimicrobiales bacterium]
MSSLMDREAEGPPEERFNPLTNRRYFLKMSGTAVALFAIACDDDDPGPIEPPVTEPPLVDLGTGDIGVLNYAYALEQLEAAFYDHVINNMYSGADATEVQILTDIRHHEVSHREFLKRALGSAAIGAATVDFSAVDFTSRDSVLTTARTFEDLGVSAYNGAGHLLENVDFLVVAGAIVSVEARHASVIRDLLAPGTAAFAGDDVVFPDTGLDVIRIPTDVLTAADPFIVNQIDASGLPAPTIMTEVPTA